MKHALLVFLLLAGCNRLLPLPQADDAATTDQASVEGSVLDIPLPPVDRGAAEMPALPDLPLPDLPLPDLALPDTQPSCTEPASVIDSPSCNQQCVSPTNDPDCDGLAGDFDPDPLCNSLLFVDDFHDPIDPAVWSIAAPPPWTCGKVKLENGTMTLADKNLLGTSGSRYLVETRFKVANLDLAGTQEWSIAIRSGLDTKGLNCEVWVSKKYGQTAPGLHINMLNTCGAPSGAWGGTAPGFAVGGTFVLQTWNSGSSSFCRVLDGGGNALQSSSSYHCPSTTPDRFYVRANNASIILDHVRAFVAN